MTLRATYRLQFTPAFGFAAAARLAPYLAALGVSHVYASPFFAARPGSTHGYDVTDHNSLNPELGDEAEFRGMAAAFRAAGLGLIADIVPNHMGIGGAANRFWLNVLEWGEASPFARWFDIDWRSSEPGLTGKVLVPFLGAPYGEALAAGALALRLDPEEGTLAVWAHETHKLPVCPRDYASVLRRAAVAHSLAHSFGIANYAAADPRWQELHAELARRADEIAPALGCFHGRSGDPASWADLDALIARQHWRAAKFNLDADAINYRRFFVISDLAGLRVEAPEVFDATHRLILRLLEEGVVDGLRIDHVDGLIDPKGYLLRLRARAARPFHLLVEKILAFDERVPADWCVDGSTGYEFANLLVGLLVDPAGVEALTRCHRDFTGSDASPEAVVRAAKLEIMERPMAAEINALAARLHALAQRDPRTRDLGRHSLRAGLKEIIAGLDVYRTYADADGLSESDRGRIAGALSRARHAAPALDPGVFDFIAAVMTLELPGDEVRDCAMRLQQASGPIMAKGLEDTALYRYTRLIALNEVGSEPGRFSIAVDAFHAANAERLAHEPNAMLATSTHDTKRGEDARMRIAAISSCADLWRENVFAWRDMLRRDDAAALDPSEEYLFYQMLLGAWPFARDGGTPPPEALRPLCARVQAAMLKSVREAGANTRWVFGDPGYEARLAGFIDRALDPGTSGAFLAAFGRFAAASAEAGARNALIQTVLKLTVPGVPDIYQGAELWEQSLVDPDNRRAVDFDRRSALVARWAGSERLPLDLSEEMKLALTVRLLALRRRLPALFAEGDYAPLRAEGAVGERICAFLRRRGNQTLLVAAALDWRQGQSARGEARLPVPGPPAEWRSALDETAQADLDPARLFARLPFTVLLGTAR